MVKKYKEAGESVAREEKLLDVINIDKVNVRFYLAPNLRRVAFWAAASIGWPIRFCARAQPEMILASRDRCAVSSGIG